MFPDTAVRGFGVHDYDIPRGHERQATDVARRGKICDNQHF